MKHTTERGTAAHCMGVLSAVCSATSSLTSSRRISIMSNSVTDRNLLFGILALQMDFISRDALVAAMHAWVLDKGKSLGQILQKQRALSADTHGLLEALVQKHLALHGNDAEQSLAAISS